MVMSTSASASVVTMTSHTDNQFLRYTSNATAVDIWRDNTENLSTHTHAQRQIHEHTFAQLSSVHTVVSEAMSRSQQPPANRETSTIPVPPADHVRTYMHSPRWWGWTTALVGVSASQGALETFCGRLAQEGVRVVSGHPVQADDVSDCWMAAHAAVNIGTAFVASFRAGLHTYRAKNNPDAYGKGLRGERPAVPSTVFAAAGTPQVPASTLVQISATVSVALAAFVAASHTGLIALTQIGSASSYKADAYNALVKSNGNSAYCYVREGINLCSRAMGLISHDALLSPRGAVASTAQYLVNSVGQQLTRSSIGSQQEDSFDYLWPCISAAAEFVDVGFIAGSTRMAEPERPVALLNGHLTEGPQAGQAPPPASTVMQAADRLTQRAVARQLVAEFTRVVPFEAGAALRPHFGSVTDTAATWGATLLAAATHLREPMWQAEQASRALHR